MYDYKITVFTPTYNRAYILGKLFDSLKQQKYTNFEWLIVDDGSTDNTEEIISRFISESPQFPIRYFKKENGGKSRAVNYALNYAQGELFFIVDSDDILTDDALEKIVYWESTIQDRKESFCGVCGNKGHSVSESPNEELPGEYVDAFCTERYSDKKYLSGERAYVVYTEIFKKYLYPEYGNERFITDCIAFDNMADAGYQIRYFQDIIWIFEYLDDGLTHQATGSNNIYINNPYGYGLFYRKRMEYMKVKGYKKLIALYSFYCDMQHKYNSREIAGFINGNQLVFLLFKLLYSMKRIIKNDK